MEGGGGSDLSKGPYAIDRLATLSPRQRSLEQKYASTFAELADLRRELAAIQASRSWRLTAPLRGWRRRVAAARAAAPASPEAAAARVVTPLPPPTMAPPPHRVCLIAPAGADAALLAGAGAAEGVTLCLLPPAAPSWAAACNAAAATAEADWIVLWDGRSAARPGWLGALAMSFAAFPDLGMAGAVLLDAQDRLLAAGLTIAPDGDLQPLGLGAAPDDPAHGFAARVDAVPLGAVMVPMTVWRRCGGLDAAIAAPDHALADLAERMRADGLQVVRQSAARLVQSAPAPRDAWDAALGRWHLRRRRMAQEGGLAVLARMQAPQPRVLMIDHYVPTPDRDAGSVCVDAFLKIFVSLGYQPTLLPVDDLARADRYVADLRRRGVQVVSGGGFRSVEDVLAAIPDAFDLIWLRRGSLAHRGMFMAMRRHSPQARVVFDSADLHFMRMEREAQLTRSAEGLDAAFRMQQQEFAAMIEADCTVLITDLERRAIADLLPQARTCCIPHACEIPGRGAGFAARRGLVFVGGFRHRPNADGMLWFLREVWPLIAGRLDTTLRIVGADPPEALRALAGPGVEVLGQVADLGPILNACRLTVAPLRYGAGMKGKVITSFAAGVPCVATSIGAEGMALTEGGNILVADTPEAFAAAVVAAHEDDGLWQRLSDGGLAFAEATCSLGAVRPRIAALLRDLGLPAPPGPGSP